MSVWAEPKCNRGRIKRISRRIPYEGYQAPVNGAESLGALPPDAQEGEYRQEYYLQIHPE